MTNTLATYERAGLSTLRPSPGSGPRTALICTAALVLCAVLAAGALAASGNFFEPPSSPEAAGDRPFSIATADLDGDGDRDLAVANEGSDNVTILRNNGTGNFFEPPSSPETAGDRPRSVAAADLDGDSDQDLAVTNYNSDNVTILRNNGTGNFFEPPSSPEVVGDSPYSVAAADLDGDSDQDLAVANTGGGVTILRNNGTGNFFQPPSSPEAVGTQPVGVAAADLDGDSDQDLAVVNRGSANVTILRNNGTANFFEPPSSPEPAGVTPYSVAVADLDGDTDQDLAVANYNSERVRILLNFGTGNFQARVRSEAVGFNPRGIAAADLDGDSDQDLAVANSVSHNVTILSNNGTADFFQPLSSPEVVGASPYSVAAADLDGDSDQDLAVVNANSDNVTILRNR